MAPYTAMASRKNILQKSLFSTLITQKLVFAICGLCWYNSVFFSKICSPQNPLHHPFGMLPKVAAALLPLGRMLPSLHADADKQRQEDLQPPKSGRFKCTLVAPFRGNFFCLSASFQKQLTKIWIFFKPKILKLLFFCFGTHFFFGKFICAKLLC